MKRKIHQEDVTNNTEGAEQTERAPVTLDEGQAFLDKINELASLLKKIEDEFKKLFVVFISYKDNNDQADTFESNLEVLVRDIPAIEKSILKMQKELSAIEELISQGICNNINYECGLLN